MVPFLHDPDLRTRRPLLFESFVETSDVEQQGGAETHPGYEPAAELGRVALARPSSSGGGASASILAPPKDYEGIRLGPYKYIAWPSGEKELYDINKDPNELNNLVKIPNYFPIRNYLHTLLTGGVDEEGGLEDCVGRTCQEPAAKIPLNRIELRRVRKQEKEEKIQERQGRTGTAGTGTQGKRTRTERKREKRALARPRPPAAPYLMIARTSPAGDGGALDHVQLLDLAGPVRRDLVLHLHRLDHADQVALGDLGALLDRDFEDRALQRRGQRLARGAGAAARFALALRRPPAAGAAGRGDPGDGLADHLDVEELAGDLDLVVAGDRLRALLGRGRRGAPARGRST